MNDDAHDDGGSNKNKVLCDGERKGRIRKGKKRSNIP